MNQGGISIMTVDHSVKIKHPQWIVTMADSNEHKTCPVIMNVSLLLPVGIRSGYDGIMLHNALLTAAIS